RQMGMRGSVDHVVEPSNNGGGPKDCIAFELVVERSVLSAIRLVKDAYPLAGRPNGRRNRPAGRAAGPIGEP
ncbi:hypothetical protein, partial [Staphylococcus aureus]